MTRFFSLFAFLVVVMFGAQLTPPVQEGLVIPFTTAIARLSAILMQAWDDQVMSQGKLIWDAAGGFAVSIEAGCNGVEAGIVLIAAMLAFPSTWTEKLVGMTVGMLTVQALNLLRIITLFYLGQWHQTWFEWAHLYLWQALIMLDVLAVFLLWLRWLSRRRPAAPAAAEANP
jgi:exosortase H (IPTLxxWG-CTERM-specific)